MSGEPGAVAVCSSGDRADALAERLLAAGGPGPSSLVVHRGVDTDLGVVRATGSRPELLERMRADADVALYAGLERRILRHRRSWPLGSVSPGAVSVYLTGARPGLSAEDFQRYWERAHAPKALRHHIGFWDYAQVSIVGVEKGSPYHGIAVAQFPHEQDRGDRFTVDELGARIIRDDTLRFADREHYESHAVDERILVEGPIPTGAPLRVGDARERSLGAEADEVWDLVGDFGEGIRWRCRDIDRCETTSDGGVGSARRLWHTDGREIVERLVHHRPEDRMAQIEMDEGLPDGVLSFRYRIESRPDGRGGTLLGMYPRATVRSDALGAFDAVVTDTWARITAGLAAAGPDAADAGDQEPVSRA